MHTRRFLSYHRDRFADQSLVVLDGKGKARGVFPAAINPHDRSMVMSHPGATYGGVVHDGSLRGGRMLDVVGAVSRHYEEMGFSGIQYRATPYIYHRVPAEDDVYAMFRLGAKRYRCDLSATIDLASRQRPMRMRLKRQRRASRLGVMARWGWSDCEAFWDILRENLRERYDVEPAHTLEEIVTLSELFPANVKLLVAVMDDHVIAGGILYLAYPTVHLQYSSANDIGKESGGLDVIVEDSINLAIEEGFRYYDFGHSNEQDGNILNGPLYDFKVSFGAGGTIFEHYEIDCTRRDDGNPNC